eukprot:CAMPEP_0197670192 /NCGR_PEP_ID=MMETSP1338-20131121/73956_1 /TAXON_ID=43686 ORGANISM="Pelagodinium beii, Strain RCC1491" /NCGR_SAMPLE_ID=MMETSP1338 /ASSEMBLY_ACC=CAM_ASM_000754 /LENGTH=46 /DNA_ID= /DNA_START= /DNA_END= /DNA_ORIENTATION=
MAMLQDSAEAVEGMSLPKATRPAPFQLAEPLAGCVPVQMGLLQCTR